MEAHERMHGEDRNLITRQSRALGHRARQLDHFLRSKGIAVTSGVLDDLPLNGSDHKLVYLDIQASLTLRIPLEEIADRPKPEILNFSLADKRTVKTYRANLAKK